MDFNFPVITDNFGGGNAAQEKTPPPQYIIKDEDGNEVAFHSMLEIAMGASSQIPTEPIEKGSFADYNRVIAPNEGSCRLALEGTDSDIQTALQALDELERGLKKVELITPFETYENLMLTSYDYRRDGHSGFNVLQVDLKLKEVREVESAKTTASVSEPPPPPPVTEEASADASCVSSEDGGQYQTYSPSNEETATAESEAGGTRRSILKDILG
jgi:hypothetical protein